MSMLTPSRVYIRRAAETFGFREEEITGRARPADLVRARWSVMLAMKGRTSAAQIGRRLNRDHSSVLHGIRVAEALRTRDPWFDEACRAVAEGVR